MTVSKLLNTAFLSSMAAYRDRQDRWVAASFQLGGKLGHSLLCAGIQKCGKIDTVVTAMESDFYHTQLEPPEAMIYDIQFMLSEIWISTIYEVCRTVRQRNINENTQKFDCLFKKLSLLRMNIDKYEIADDRKMKSDLTFVSLQDPQIQKVYSNPSGRSPGFAGEAV